VENDYLIFGTLLLILSVKLYGFIRGYFLTWTLGRLQVVLYMVIESKWCQWFRIKKLDIFSLTRL
jgi:hypothetical protein